MRLQELKRGRVIKVVHVRFASPAEGCEPNMEPCDGYGILQDGEGQEIYFVDAAIQDADLSDLHVGMELRYLAEESPLLRASKIWVVPRSEQLQISREIKRTKEPK